MMSGIIKRVLAFTICIAMLTGSIPASAEGTVSGSEIPVVTGSDIGIGTDTTNENEEVDSTVDNGDSETTVDNDSNGETTIVDEETPESPAPSTDGTGSVPGGTVSGNTDNSQTVSENKIEDSISDNTVSDNSVSDNSVSDNTLSGNSIEFITWAKTVDGVTITVSANKVSVPEGTDLSVEQLDPVEVEVLENTIAEEEAEQNFVVKKYKAFDITLINDGEPVTPSEEVKVTFTGDILVDELEDGDELKVYHLDDAATQSKKDKKTGDQIQVAELNDMSGTVDSDSVEMDTPHFSTYLIALTGENTANNNIVKNDYVSVELSNDIPVYNYSTESADYDNYYDYYIQTRVFLNNELVCIAPNPADDNWNQTDENNLFIDISDATSDGKRDVNQPIIVTPQSGYSVSKIEFGAGTSYANSNRASLDPSSYSINLAEYKDNNANTRKNNYLDVYITSALTTENFKINLFDYDTNATNSASADATGSGQPFLFIPESSGNYNSKAAWNVCHYDGVYQNLVQEDLLYDKPVFNYKTADLFGNDTSWKDSYFNVDFPFSYDSATKYYEFDSTKHKADFNTSTEIMTVTNASNPQFFPFGSGNYHFGMNMSVDFYMSDDGMLDGQPIIYSFAGDDDVWVFIDGKLVLDLGGIHPTYSGDINFSTGDVSVSNVSPGNNNSTYNLYQSDKGITLAQLADGEKHRLQIFYLERGAGNSNCKIKFNLPQVPQKNVLKVTNTVSNNNLEEGEVDETTFVYTIKKGTEILKGVSYTFTDQLIPANSGTRTTNSVDGTFTLSTGQSATFDKNQDGTKITEGTYNITQMLKTEYESAYESYKDLTQISDTTSTPVSLGAETQLVSTFNVVLDTTSSHVYKADYTNNCIEAVPPVINTTKSANLIDWENRTYNISLSANAVVGSHVVTQNSDIMLVLDRSGSMGDNDTFTNYQYTLLNSTGSTSTLNTNRTYYVKSSADSEIYHTLEYEWSSNISSSSWIIYYSNGGSDYYSTVKTNYPFIYNRTATTTTINRMTTLKSAANGFIDMTNAESPDSKVGVASFEQTARLDMPLVDVSDNIAALKSAINGLQAYGWTRPDLGLSQAYNQLTSNASTNQKKYVILFTDGEPTIGTGTVNTMKANAVTQANNLKELGVTVYSVFLGTDTTNRDWLANSIATSTAHAFSASNASGLEAIFDQISQEISDYENATITDYIDSRFALVKADNTTPYLESEIGLEGITLSDGGVLKIDDNGQQYITWTVPISMLTKGNTWNKNIVVKVKDSFIGDNNVTTNGTGSGVTIGGVTEPFEQPVVNVRARFSAKEASDVIFDGETLGETLVEIAGVLMGDYLNTEKQHQIFNPESLVWIDGDEEIPLAAIPDGAGFTYEWYRDDGDLSFDSGDLLLGGNIIYDQSEAGKYFLKVIYTPHNPSDESTGASNGNVVTENNSYAVGTYTVDVITGRITVHKTIRRSEIRFSQGDPIFTFKLIGDNGKTYYKQVRFTETKAGTLNPNNPDQYITLTTTFDGLTKGNYTLSEEYSVRYQMAEISGVSLEAGLSSGLTGNTATYQMAVPENLPTDKIVDGTATFRNEKTYDKNDSDTDIVVNRFTMDSEGNLIVSADKINVE